MKIYKPTSSKLDNIMCMANVRGCKVTVPHRLPFSFYFSTHNSNHAIRVKVVFNPDKLIPDKLGILELHGDWNYIPGSDDTGVSNKQIMEMKSFFRQYKVLFAAVWNLLLPEDTVQDYLRGHISLQELITDFYIYEDYSEWLSSVNNVEELEIVVRHHKLFNMWD